MVQQPEKNGLTIYPYRVYSVAMGIKNSVFWLLTLCLLAASSAAQARDVSYAGGWTLMVHNDASMNASHIHYSPTAKYSIGWRHEYMRESDANMDAAQLNWLLLRQNNPGSQANLYLKSGIGVAYDGDDVEPAAFTGLAADWENRRFFTMYENHFMTAGSIDKSARHMARVGVAPYIGDYGDLHTWLMLQADYDAGDDTAFSVTPLVRLFKGPVLGEAGYNLQKDTALFNLMIRF